MPATDYAEDLRESAERIAHRLAQRELEMSLAMAMSLADIRELEWLAQDDTEYIDEMSLGGTTYKPK